MAEEKKPAQSPYKSPAWKILIVFAVFAVVVYFWGEATRTKGVPAPHAVSYTRFMEELKADNVKSVTLRGLEVEGAFRAPLRLKPPGAPEEVETREFSTRLPSFQGAELMGEFEKKGVTVTVEPEDAGSAFWQIAIVILPWVLIIGIWLLILRRSQQAQGGPGGVFGFGASKAKLFDVKKPSVRFSNVAGLENAKRELSETVEFLKDPSRFISFGAKVPKGILLVGPPGTGKTLLARAVAGEAGVPFFSISASEFIEMFVGVGASRVRDMFRKARETRPSIIFIDEIDSVGRTRGAGLGGGHDEREQTLNQLLSEMDGFEPHEEIIVMAATNRPDVLDPALLRPGRFDRHVVIDRPGWKDRKAILEVHTANKKMSPGADLGKIAKGTPGMTGADLENLANEAALYAVKKGKAIIEMEDFEEARDKVLMGAKREETFTAEEKKITAYHEAGHALASLDLPLMDPIHKVSIIPRGMAMGVTQFLPEEDRHYYPRSYLINRLTVALSGRAAEKLVFRDVSSGAQDDLKNATALAEKMVAQWGMSDEVGPVNLGRAEEHPFLGRELAMPKRYSEEMAWIMDREIRKLILEAEAKADEIMARNKASLKALAEALLKDEMLEREDIERIVRGARDSKPAPEERA